MKTNNILKYIKKEHTSLIKIIDCIENNKIYQLSNQERLYQAIFLYFRNNNIDLFLESLKEIKDNGFDTKHLLNNLFDLGLHDEVVSYINLIDDENEILKIKEILKMKKLNLFPLFFNKLNISFKGNILKTKTKILLDEIKKLNPNENLSKYIEVYGQLQFRIGDDEVNEYLKKIKMYPYVNEMHNWNLRKLDLKQYYQRLSTYRDTELSDLIFLSIADKYKLNLDEFLVNKIARLIDINLIDEFKIKIDYNNSDFNNLVLNRIILENKNPFYKSLKIENKKSYDFAICISGQFRGGEECIPYWLKESINKNIPIFLSVWDKIGVPSGAHGNKLQRMVPEEIKNLFSNISDLEFYQDLKGISEVFENEDVSEKIDFLIENFPKADLHTEILNESKVDLLIKNQKVTNKNQFKMFYNMTNVMNMLKKYEYINNKRFKNIIWVRPDLKIKKFNFQLIEENKIRMHTIGDFIMQFPRSKCIFMENLENLLVENFDTNKTLNGVGPLLLKRSAWFNGLFIEGFKNSIFSGLVSVKPQEKIFYEKVFDILQDNPNINKSKYFDLFKISHLHVKLFSDNPFDSIMIKNNYNISNDFCANWFRDLAVKIEDNDLETAYRLMLAAKSIRPDGPFIIKKVKEYEIKLGIKNEKSNN